MEYKEWRNMDEQKAKWGAGPWTQEPDAVQWQDEATGLPCLIHRNSMGALCGYVGVSEGHPDFAKGYSDETMEYYEVHGGLTYSDFCRGDPGEGICHMPRPGEPDKVWWFGFDCGHSGDLIPGMASLGLNPFMSRTFGDEAIYRDIAYVKAECAKLAGQLKDHSHA